MNLASPTFANPLFRQAIIRAIDRNAGGVRRPAGAAGEPGGGAAGRAGRGGRSVRGRRAPIDQARPRRWWPRRSRPGGVPTVEIDTDDDPADVALANAVQASAGGGRHPVQGRAAAVRRVPALHHHGQAAAVPHRVGRAVRRRPGAYLAPLFRSTSLDNSTAFSSAAVDAPAGRGPGHGQRIAAPARRTRRCRRTIMADFAVRAAGLVHAGAGAGQPGARLRATAGRHLRRRQGRGQGSTGTTGTTGK